MSNKLFLSFAAAVAFAFTSTISWALPVIEGQLDITGNATHTVDTNGFIESVDFVDPTSTPNGSPTVNIATGSFAAEGISFGDDVAIVDPINFATSIPQLSFWSVGGFTFDLNSVITRTATEVTGYGLLNHADYASTAGWFSLTTQNLTTLVSFSSTTVPEPASLVLLGLGLAGLGFSRRKAS